MNRIIYDNKSALIIVLIVILLGITACDNLSVTDSQDSNKQKNNIEKLKITSISEYMQQIRSIGTLEFDAYKQIAGLAFKQIYMILPNLESKDVELSKSNQAYKDIIAEASTRIGETVNPQEIVVNEKVGFEAIIGALRNINNNSDKPVANLDQRLAKVEKMVKKLNTSNYQVQSRSIFLELGLIMNDMRNKLQV